LEKPFPVKGKKWDELLQVLQFELGDLELRSPVALQSPNPSSKLSNQVGKTYSEKIPDPKGTEAFSPLFSRLGQAAAVSADIVNTDPKALNKR
jgi:hypothetical protein